MSERLMTNTKSLHQHYPAIYRDFFARCQRVASASNSFLWTGEFAGFYGGLTVSQKLPIRSYVGLETTFDNQVSVNHEYLTFQADKQAFVTAVADDRLRNNLCQYLETELARQSNFSGIRVHLLTEIPLGHGLGSNGAIAAALAVLLTNQAEFEISFAKARDILSLSQAGYSSGVSAYMALTDLQGPVVFFTHEDDYFAKPITELANLNSSLVWPIDYGLIYSGGGANAESVILANNQTVTELEASGHRLNELLNGRQSTNFRQTYIDMLNLTSSLIIIALTDLFTQGSKNNLLEQLFDSLNHYQNLLHMVHVSDSSSDLIYSRIHQLANKQGNDVGSGVKISGIGKGGAVLFAVPYGIHRQALVELIDQLRTETGRNLCLDYASWLDGVGGEPGRIEQDISKKQHSHFIAQDSLQLLIVQQGDSRHERVTNERFESYAKEINLWLDRTTGKILIAGRAVTSKEVPSQKATVSILADLLRAKGFILKNIELPSSYGTNRYDLQGKIVLPLIKVVKERTGRDLQLTIRGGMYDDYQLTLDPSNITIGIIEKKN